MPRAMLVNKWGHAPGTRCWMPDTSLPKRSMSTRQLALWMGKRRTTVEQLVRSGAIRSFVVAGSVRIDPQAVAEFIRNNTTSPPRPRRQRRPVTETWYS